MRTRAIGDVLAPLPGTGSSLPEGVVHSGCPFWKSVPMSGPVRAFAYARVSTEEQADSGLGLDAQITAATAGISARGWTLAAKLVDAGISGEIALARRPALGPALVALNQGAVGAHLRSR